MLTMSPCEPVCLLLVLAHRIHTTYQQVGVATGNNVLVDCQLAVLPVCIACCKQASADVVTGGLGILCCAEQAKTVLLFNS